MEDSAPIGDYIEKKRWYRTGWGEAAIVIFLLVAIGTGLFLGGVAVEVKRIMASGNVNDISGEGTISLSTNAPPVSDAKNIKLVENASMSLGNPNADLTIVEFGDFGCPYTADASKTMREMAAKYPKRFHYIFKDFPNTDLHPDAEKAALAARCAAVQGKFWAYHDKLFANQSAQDDMSLARYASEVGLDTNAFATCYASKQFSRDVQTDFETGVQEGLRGTPTFFLNGHRAEGALPADALEAVLLKFAEK